MSACNTDEPNHPIPMTLDERAAYWFSQAWLQIRRIREIERRHGRGRR